MEDETSTGGTAPRRVLTINQVVAWNIARYRRAAKLKQRELGDRIGWTNAAVSEAERSWDGNRVREFDAHVLARLSLALGVPLIALFIPPQDDDDSAPYVFSGPDGEHGMGYLLERVVMSDSEDDSPARRAYRQDLDAAARRYLGDRWQERAAAMLAEPDDLRALRAGRLRDYADALMAQAADQYAEITGLADALDPRREQP